MITATSPLIAASPLAWALDSVRLDEQPFTPYPYQAALLADRSTRRIILKARQVGMSTAVAIEAAHLALHTPRSLVLMVSRSQDAAVHLLGLVYAILDGLAEPVGYAKRNELEAVLAHNGAMVKSLPANPGTGRGITASAVYLDEFAHATYDGEIYAAVSPTVARGGRLTVLSTPRGQGNAFYRAWHGDLGGDWSKHTVHWRDCPRYTGEWYDQERPRYTSQQWASEFDLDFTVSGDTVFNPADIDAMAKRAVGLRGPRKGGEYVTGWDIGRRRDASVGITLDVTKQPVQIVGYERLVRQPYPRIQSAIEARHRRFGGRTLVESNGVGDPLIENLAIPVESFVTTAKSKVQAIERLQLLIEQRRLKARDVPQLVSELRGYRWDDASLVQDSVMALAVACSSDWVEMAGGKRWILDASSPDDDFDVDAAF